MGNFWSRVFTSRRQYRILLQGLDCAGKTTLLYRMKLGEISSSYVTIGMVVESVKYKSVLFTSWDINTRCKIRPIYRHFYKDADAIIFVIDSADKERIEEARDELHQMLSEETLTDCPLLVLANKQDLPRAMPAGEVSTLLNLEAIKQDWAIYATSATEMVGVHQALEWLSDILDRKSSEKTGYLAAPVTETVEDVKQSVIHTNTSVKSIILKATERLQRWLT